MFSILKMQDLNPGWEVTPYPPLTQSFSLPPTFEQSCFLNFMFFHQGRRKSQWSNWQARALLLSLEKKLFQVENFLKTLFNSRKNCSDTLSQPRLFFFLSWLSSSLSSSFWSSRLGGNKTKVRLFQQLFQQWIDKLIVEKNYFQFLRYIPKILLAIIIPIFDGFYHKVAVWLNDMGESIMYKIIFCKFLNMGPPPP